VRERGRIKSDLLPRPAPASAPQKRVFSFASHGLLSGAASDLIAHSELEEVVVTNTVPLRAAARANDKIVQLSVAPLLAEAIKRVHLKQSVSALFKNNGAA